MNLTNLKRILSGGVVAGAAASAQGAVVTTDFTTPVTAASGDTVYFNVVSGQASTTDFDGSQFQLNLDTSGSSPKPTITATGTGLGVETGFAPFMYNNSPGETVGSSDTFMSSISAIYAVPGSDPIIAGLNFNPSSTDSTVDYGYAVFTFNSDQSLSLDSLAYDNLGLDITVVPEPSSLALALLSAGSVAAYALRRRRLAGRQS